MKGFAELAKERMDALGMDQKTLSEKSGIPASSLNRYLNGTKPRIDIITRVADALGVEPSYFIDDVKPLIEPYQEVVNVVGRSKTALTPEEKRKIIEMLLS